MTDPLFDIAIVGAGPTGAALALGLAQMDLAIAVIDARDPSRDAPLDGRNFAIVTGSWRLLRSIGIADLLHEDSQPLNGLEATDGGTHYFGQPSVLFSSRDLDSPDPDEPLGQMVMATPLQAKLDQAMAEAPKITRFAPERFQTLETSEAQNTITLESGREVRARLVVGADGMRSPVRNTLGIETEGREAAQQ